MAVDTSKLSEQLVTVRESDESNGTYDIADQPVLVRKIDRPVDASQSPVQQASAVEAKQDNDEYPWQVNIQVCFLITYYVGLLLFFFWLLFDFWSSNFSFIGLIGIQVQALDDTALQLLRTIGFTIIGGSLGNILYRIRQLHHHYCKAHFNPRWIGKYISEPWESAAMAVVVLALIHGGISLFAGSASTDVTSVNNFTTFGTGALVGFGVNKVVKWLDYQVARTFNREVERGTA